MRTAVALVVLSWLLPVLAPVAAAEKVILVSPLPFGVDVYLNMTRQGRVEIPNEVPNSTIARAPLPRASI